MAVERLTSNQKVCHHSYGDPAACRLCELEAEIERLRAALEDCIGAALNPDSKEPPCKVCDSIGVIASNALRPADETKTGMPPETCEFSDSHTHECKHCDALFGPAVKTNPQRS